MGIVFSGSVAVGAISNKLVTYNGVGDISVNTGTFRWYPIANGFIKGAYFSLNTAGDNTTVVSIKMNGVEIISLSALTGENRSNISTNNITITPTDYITVDVIAAGVGAADLAVFLMYQ